MTAPTPQLRGRDTRDAPDVRRPLNDALAALTERLSALEAGGLVMPLVPMEFTTGGSVTAGASPWPIYVRLPAQARPVVGFVVLRLLNLTTPAASGIPTTGHSAHAEVTGDGQAVLQFVSGLSTSTTYRLTLGVVYA